MTGPRRNSRPRLPGTDAGSRKLVDENPDPAVAAVLTAIEARRQAKACFRAKRKLEDALPSNVARQHLVPPDPAERTRILRSLAFDMECLDKREQDAVRAALDAVLAGTTSY